ncbi:MAG: aminoglycoside phosphotransferase family protein [Candidatus Micrarchaeia archaeon]
MKTQNADKFLEKLKKAFSFKRIRKLASISKNESYVCKRGKKSFVLKKYVASKQNEAEKEKRAQNEVYTYLAVEDPLGLPRVLAYDSTKFFITEHENVQKISRPTKKLVQDAAQLLSQIHSLNVQANPHSYKYDYNYYKKNLKLMLNLLMEKNILSQQDDEFTKNLLKKNKNAISQAQKTFVHGDFHLENLARFQKRLIAMDYEYSGRGSPTYDLAIFALSINDEKLNKEFTKKYLQQNPLKNFNALYLFLTLWRSLELIYAFCDKKTSRQFKTAIAEYVKIKKETTKLKTQKTTKTN